MRSLSMKVLVVSLLLLALSTAVHAQKTLTLMTYGNPDQQVYYDLIKVGFERDNSGYTLDVEIVAYGEYIEKVLINYAAGTVPDVFMTWAQYKPQFAEDGVILDLTRYIESSDVMRLENFYPVIKENISYEGRYWGSPWGFNSTLWIANVDMLDRNGLGVPDANWTVREFRDYARKVARPDEQIFALNAAPIRSGSGAPTQWLENWAGHRWMDEAGKRVLVAEEGSVDMIEYWRELAVDLRVIPSGPNPRASGANFLTTGDVAFEQNWSTITSNVARLTDQGASVVNWEFVTYPKAEHGQGHFAQGHLWTIPGNHPDPDEAWKLIEWLGSEEADYIWSSSQRTPPAMPIREHWEAYNRDLPAEQREKALDFIIGVLYQGELARNFEYWPTFGEMSSIWNQQMTRVLDGQAASKVGADEAARQMQQVLDEYWADKE